MTTLNISELHHYATLKAVTGTDAKQLNIAAQSIAKRVEYCDYHLLQFRQSTENGNLFLDRIGEVKASNGVSLRTIYEANVVAFLQNLHSLVDSAPYILNIIFRKVPDIENPSISWSSGFLSKYSAYKFYPEWNSLFESEQFCKIKGLVNRTKHKHLVRLRNTCTSLQLEEYDYKFHNKLSTISDQDVLKLMIESNDFLVPKIIAALNAIIVEPI